MDFTLPIKQLKDGVDIRRAALMRIAEKRRRGRRNLTLLCGVIALLSGTGMSAVLLPALDNQYLKITSALLAFVAGTLNLVLTSMFDDKETRRMIDGAGRLLTVKQQIEHFLLSNEFTAKQVQEFFKKVSVEAVKIYNDVDSLISAEKLIKSRRSADGTFEGGTFESVQNFGTDFGTDQIEVGRNF